MSWPRSLQGRLLAAQITLVAVVVGSGMLTVRLLTPVLFNRGYGNGAGAVGTGRGNGGQGRGLGKVDGSVSVEIQDAYNEALTRAVLFASLIGLLAATLLAVVLGRRLLGRLSAVDQAAKRLAAGDYDYQIEIPPETELAGLARSVNQLGTSLAASEAARARLMSDVAHEIRNPLTTIEGYMEGLIDGVLPADEVTFGEVADEAHRLRRIAEDLSFISRAEEGAVQYDMASVDLAEIARHSVQRLKPLAGDAGILLKTSLDEELPVTADAGRITQALTNLINNAVAHTPTGGQIAVTGSRLADYCEIRVEDNGDGIPPENLETIFERFTRFRDGAGIGIGLHIARSIATGHHGTLQAASPGSGLGSTFTLSLPVEPS